MEVALHAVSSSDGLWEDLQHVFGAVVQDETFQAVLQESEAALLGSSAARQLLGQAQKYLSTYRENGVPNQLLKEWTKLLEGLNSKVSPEVVGQLLVGDQIKKAAVDFLLSSIPQLNIPPIKGIKDDTEYEVSNFDLGDFQVNPDQVDVRMSHAGIRVKISGISCTLNNLAWKFKMNAFPFLSGEGTANARADNATFDLTLRVRNNATKPDQPAELQLAMKKCRFDFHQLDVTIAESWWSRISNLLINLFRQPIRVYVQKSLSGLILWHSDKLLSTLNVLSKDWLPVLAMMAPELVSTHLGRLDKDTSELESEEDEDDLEEMDELDAKILEQIERQRTREKWMGKFATTSWWSTPISREQDGRLFRSKSGKRPSWMDITGLGSDGSTYDGNAERGSSLVDTLPGDENIAVNVDGGVGEPEERKSDYNGARNDGDSSVASQRSMWALDTWKEVFKKTGGQDSFKSRYQMYEEEEQVVVSAMLGAQSSQKDFSEVQTWARGSSEVGETAPLMSPRMREKLQTPTASTRDPEVSGGTWADVFKMGRKQDESFKSRYQRYEEEDAESQNLGPDALTENECKRAVDELPASNGRAVSSNDSKRQTASVHGTGASPTGQSVLGRSTPLSTSESPNVSRPSSTSKSIFGRPTSSLPASESPTTSRPSSASKNRGEKAKASPGGWTDMFRRVGLSGGGDSFKSRYQRYAEEEEESMHGGEQGEHREMLPSPRLKKVEPDKRTPSQTTKSVSDEEEASQEDMSGSSTKNRGGVSLAASSDSITEAQVDASKEKLVANIFGDASEQQRQPKSTINNGWARWTNSLFGRDAAGNDRSGRTSRKAMFGFGRRDEGCEGGIEVKSKTGWSSGDESQTVNVTDTEAGQDDDSSNASSKVSSLSSTPASSPTSAASSQTSVKSSAELQSVSPRAESIPRAQRKLRRELMQRSSVRQAGPVKVGVDKSKITSRRPSSIPDPNATQPTIAAGTEQGSVTSFYSLFANETPAHTDNDPADATNTSTAPLVVRTTRTDATIIASAVNSSSINSADQGRTEKKVESISATEPDTSLLAGPAELSIHPRNQSLLDYYSFMLNTGGGDEVGPSPSKSGPPDDPNDLDLR